MLWSTFIWKKKYGLNKEKDGLLNFIKEGK